MSSLVVVAYPSLYQAEEVRLQLLKMQKEYLVDLEDAVIAVRKADGKVKLHQLYSLTAAGAVGGGFWGLLIGLIFLNPLLGVAVGAGAGAVSGALSDVGVNDEFGHSGPAAALLEEMGLCASHIAEVVRETVKG